MTNWKIEKLKDNEIKKKIINYFNKMNKNKIL
jgi:hypothetical protein